MQCNFLKALPAGLLGRDGLRVDADPEATNQVILGAGGKKGRSRNKGAATGKKRPAPREVEEEEEDAKEEKEEESGSKRCKTRRAGRHL